MGAGATIAAEELSPGSRVGGRYRVEAILGKGGMGTVYRAHDEQQRREVALKVLHQRVFAEQQALRTKHEFRAMVQLRHPRMVEVQDYGVLSAGTPFFVMQLLEGRDLQGAGQLAMPLVYQVVAAVADALGFMHARGYVHRDVKPANVHLSSGAPPEVKLLDFGTAELTGLGAGTIAGTLRYLAPESHYAGAADPRVDLYALGVLAYEITTGSCPFTGHGAAELLRAKLARLPPLDVVRPEVPPAFARLVADLLAPEPSARPRNCQEVSARLAAIAGPVEATLELSAELRTPAVAGRKDELGRLRSEFQAAAEGKARALFLVAPAGAGKTRVFEEALLEVRVTGAQVAIAHPRGFGRQPYETLRALLSTMLHQPGAAAALASAGGAEALGALHPEAQAHAPARGEPARDPVAEREIMHAGLARFVAALATQHPVVLGIDDIHVADSASLEALGSLLGACRGARLALCGTIREGETISAPLRRLLDMTEVATRVPLQPLGSPQLGELLATTLGPCEPSERLLADIARASAGNVYFVLEILRSMIRRGVLSRARTGVVLPAQLDPADVPGSLAEALLARMEQIGALARRTLTALAVLGREAEMDTLAAILGAPEEDFLDALVELRRGEFIETDVGRVRVHHPRVREVLAAALPEAERVALHRRVAEVLEKAGSAGASQPSAAELAVHWAGAGVRRRALELWVLAGDGRYDALAHHDAGEAYKRAEQLLDAAPRGERLELERKLCDRLGRIGFLTEHGAAIPYLERAWKLHLSAGILSWIPKLGRVMPRALAVALALGVTGLGNALRLRKQPFARALQSLLDAFAAGSYLATCYSYTGRFQLAVVAAEALRPYVYSETKLPQAAVEIGLGTALFHMGRFDDGARACEAAVRILDTDLSPGIAQHDRERAVAGMVATRTWCDLARGHLRETEWTRRLDRCVKETPSVILDAWMAQVNLQRAILKGRTDEMLALWEQASRLPPVAQVVFVHDSARYLAGLGLFEAGRVAEAIDLADAILERSRRLDNLQVSARALYLRGVCLREWGHLAEGEACFREGVPLARHPDSDALDSADVLELGLAECALDAGRLDEAEAQARAVYARTERYQKQNDLMRLRARRVLARIALRRGQPAQALEDVTFSLRWAEELALPLEVAHSARVLADVHEARGAADDKAKALQRCEKARRAIDNKYQLSRLGLLEVPPPARGVVPRLGASSGVTTPAALDDTAMSGPAPTAPTIHDALAATIDGPATGPTPASASAPVLSQPRRN